MSNYRRSGHTTGSESSVDKDFCPLPEVVHLQFSHDAQPEKEVGISDEKEGVENFAYGLPLQRLEYQNGSQQVDGYKPTPGRRPSKKTWLVCAVLAALSALGVGLGVGLTFGLRRHTWVLPFKASDQLSDLHPRPTTKAQHPASATSRPASTTSSTHIPLYFSTRGAFNGTSIAVTKDRNGQNLTSSAPGSFNKWNLVLVYQHYTGELRWMQRIYLSSTWVGGSAYDVVATDAKNATPISVNFKEAGGVAYHHVFCRFPDRSDATSKMGC